MGKGNQNKNKNKVVIENKLKESLSYKIKSPYTFIDTKQIFSKKENYDPALEYHTSAPVKNLILKVINYNRNKERISN